MVIRHYITCLTCRFNYTLRVGLGFESLQSHTFQCIECHEDISVSLDVDNKNVTLKFNYVENCEAGNVEGHIYNLHSESVFPESELHRDKAFPWMGDLHTISERQQQYIDDNGIVIDKIREKLAMQEITPVEDLWKVLKKAWRLDINGRTDLSLQILKEYKVFEFTEEKTLENCLHHLCYRIIDVRGYSILRSTMDVYRNANVTNATEYSRFLDYYTANLQRKYFKNYFNIFSEFFANYSEYNQVILKYKHGISLGENAITGSSAFNKTKMFYGNAFEIYTSSLTVVACINNLNSGRKYDEFESMNLSKYLTVNKARRAEPFKEVNELQIFSDCLESTLRNASHHQSIELKGKKVHYRSGGTGEKRTMPYAVYLSKCVDIFVSQCILLMMEQILIVSLRNEE